MGPSSLTSSTVTKKRRSECKHVSPKLLQAISSAKINQHSSSEWSWSPFNSNQMATFFSVLQNACLCGLNYLLLKQWFPTMAALSASMLLLLGVMNNVILLFRWAPFCVHVHLVSLVFGLNCKHCETGLLSFIFVHDLAQ